MTLEPGAPALARPHRLDQCQARHAGKYYICPPTPHLTPPAPGESMRRAPSVVAALVITSACGPKRPPPSFAPDPGLVSQIRELRMSTNATACPGESFGAVYTAVLNDGALVPFESRYDKDNPPRLHVVFLERSSYEATPLEGGGWSAARDPLASAMTGFRLTATFRAKTSVTTTSLDAPAYGDMHHVLCISRAC